MPIIYHRARAERSIELVWTGPSTELVATRRTEQVLIQLIGAASKRIFITSFVAYRPKAIVTALAKAIERGVDVSILLESSDAHGGSLSSDLIGKMKDSLPEARFYFWKK